MEDLRDEGVRIISIGDNIDFPNDDDWLKIQFQFMINEMPLFGVIANAINVSLLPAFLFVLLALMVVMHEMLNKVCAKHG